MTAELFAWPYAGKTELARAAEMYETPDWAAESILDSELLTPFVVDPCCGRGVLAEAARRRGYGVHALDLHNWGYPLGDHGIDFLTWRAPQGEFSVFMNPPFSKAVEFVRHSLDLGARKIVCFQRFAWWESGDRRQFWASCPPARIHICRTRADCWRIDIPPAERKGRSSPTAHAWFVWERGHPPAATLGHIDRRKS